jgi:HD-GYP domain-containing protein (c-di-GMP phosphodiesterase class II)
MTQHALQAEASSILLLDEDTNEFFFEVAEGEAGKNLKTVRLDARKGIAGLVLKKGKPIIINDVRKDKHFNRSIDQVTNFFTKSIMCAPLMVNRKTIGVIEVINKLGGNQFSEQDMETLVAVAATAAMAIENSRLHQSVLDGYKSTIKALAAAIDAKDPYTRGHSQRVVEYALLTGKALSLSSEDLEVLEYAGILHDVGKIGIPENILGKPEALTDEEYIIIKRHPIISSDIIADIPFLNDAISLVLHHHERYDGKGYPDGLKGELIPLGARILAVADAFDAMTTDRPYRKAMNKKEAIQQLHLCSGSQLCPTTVTAFVSNIETKFIPLHSSNS